MEGRKEGRKERKDRACLCDDEYDELGYGRNGSNFNHHGRNGFKKTSTSTSKTSTATTKTSTSSTINATSTTT